MPSILIKSSCYPIGRFSFTTGSWSAGTQEPVSGFPIMTLPKGNNISTKQQAGTGVPAAAASSRCASKANCWGAHERNGGVRPSLDSSKQRSWQAVQLCVSLPRLTEVGSNDRWSQRFILSTGRQTDIEVLIPHSLEAGWSCWGRNNWSQWGAALEPPAPSLVAQLLDETIVAFWGGEKKQRVRSWKCQHHPKNTGWGEDTGILVKIYPAPATGASSSNCWHCTRLQKWDMSDKAGLEPPDWGKKRG